MHCRRRRVRLLRTIGKIFESLCDPDHLARAAAFAARGKRRRRDVAAFLFRREESLARIRAALTAGTWLPAGFELHFVRDPKPRVIARAPFEDRIVHAAVTLLVEPHFLRCLSDDAFACRRGFGTHRARLRLLEFIRRHRFALHLDIRSYFPSIDLSILRALLARRIQDSRFLEVIDRILECGAGLYDAPGVCRFARIGPDWPPSGGGLPIGALTSQLFAAHVYLCALDHFIRRDLKVLAYLRYVDDLHLFASRRAALRMARSGIGRWLAEVRRLRLKVPRAPVLSCAGHLDALGARILRSGIEPLPRALGNLGVAARRCCRGLPRPRPPPNLSAEFTSRVAVALGDF